MREETFNNIRLFRSVIDKELLISNILSSSAMGNICLACSILVFLFFIIEVLKKTCSDELKNRKMLNVIIKALIIIGAFGNILIYKNIAMLIYSLSDSMDKLFGLDIIKARMQMEYLFHEMLNKRLEDINIINPLTWTGTIDVLLSSIFLYLFIMTMYSLLTIPTVFLGFSITVAPIMAAFSIVKFNFFKNWLKLILASMFMVFFVNVIIKLISNTDMIVLLSETLHEDNPIVIISICLLYSIFCVYAIAVTGYIFKARILGILKIILPIGILEFCLSQTLGIQRAIRKYKQ